MNCQFINHKIEINEFDKFYYNLIKDYLLHNYNITCDKIRYDIYNYVFKDAFIIYTDSKSPKNYLSNYLLEISNRIINIRKNILFKLCDNFVSINKIPQEYNKISMIFNEFYIQKLPLYKCRKAGLTKETAIVDLFVPIVLFTTCFLKFFERNILLLFCENTHNNNTCIFINDLTIMDNIKNMRDDISSAQDFCVEYNYYFNKNNNNIVNIFNIDRDNCKVFYNDTINKKIESNDSILSFGNNQFLSMFYVDPLVI